jgi:hypothetical protein
MAALMGFSLQSFFPVEIGVNRLDPASHAVLRGLLRDPDSASKDFAFNRAVHL